MGTMPKKQPVPFSTKVVWVGVLMLVLWLMSGGGAGNSAPPGSPAVQQIKRELEDPLHFIIYGSWHEEVRLDLARSLVASGVHGCGEFRWKQNNAQPDEYAVQCSKDGKTWRTYLVWPRIEKASGPYKAPLTPE